MGITETTNNLTYHYHLSKGVGMTPEEYKMLKQLIEIQNQLLSIPNQGMYGEAVDLGAQIVVKQLIERYKTTEEEILEHTTE